MDGRLCDFAFCPRLCIALDRHKYATRSANSGLTDIPGGPKSDTFFNYVDIMSDKLQNTTYLNWLDSFNIYY